MADRMTPSPEDVERMIERLRKERVEWEYHSNPPRKVAVVAGLVNPDGPAAADMLAALSAIGGDE